MSLADNIEFLRRLPKLNEIKSLNSFARGFNGAGASGRLVETVGFGSNPGDLKMFSYQPDDQRARKKTALVVVLHGCTQTAADYEKGPGWKALADKWGFVLLLPQQELLNNPNLCFNWFNGADPLDFFQAPRAARRT